jgi:hypothetical protein
MEIMVKKSNAVYRIDEKELPKWEKEGFKKYEPKKIKKPIVVKPDKIK